MTGELPSSFKEIIERFYSAPEELFKGYVISIEILGTSSEDCVNKVALCNKEGRKEVRVGGVKSPDCAIIFKDEKDLNEVVSNVLPAQYLYLEGALKVVGHTEIAVKSVFVLNDVKKLYDSCT